MNENNVFKMWHDSIGDVEKADVSVLNDVISVHGGYKQCDLSIDDFLNNVHCLNVNALSSYIPVPMQNGLPTSKFCKGTPVLLWHNISNIMMHRKHG